MNDYGQKDYTLFDIIGPIMIGPSSSHTAGACRIGYTAQSIVKGDIQAVVFTLYGSFARTYSGHGTDVALLGGILGFRPDDERIVDAFEIAKSRGLDYSFKTDYSDVAHPNTVNVHLVTTSGQVWDILGVSIGGGKMVIQALNGILIEYTGSYNTLVTHHRDTPGLLAKIAGILADRQINIANMRLFREEKGTKAIGIIETDESIDPSALEALSVTDGIYYFNVIEKIYD
jgi:L-serine dehydratase